MIVKNKFPTSLAHFCTARLNWWETEALLSSLEERGLCRKQLLKAKRVLDNDFAYIQQNLEFLEEAAVPISVKHLTRTRSIATADIHMLYKDKLIPDLNVTERYLKAMPEFRFNPDLPMPSLMSIAEVYAKKIQYHRRLMPSEAQRTWPEVTSLETELTLITEQRRVFRQFFVNHFSTNYLTIDRLMYNYMGPGTIRACRSVMTTLDILENHLELPKNLILRNFYLINVSSERLKELIDKIKTVGPVDLKTAALMAPKILAKTTAEIIDMERAFQEYGIKTTSPCRVHVMALTATTLRSRLKELSQGEMKAYLVHPRVCELIIYFIKVRKRFKEIEKCRMKCISLHTLTGNQKLFERYLSEGVDRTRYSQDVLYYLADALGINRKTVYGILKQHPLRFFVALADVMATTEALLARGIPKDVILESVPVVLYPREHVMEVLDKIDSDKELNDLGFSGGFVDEISAFQAGSKFRDRRMILCLYYLEVPFHFTGDGVMRASNKSSSVDAAPT